ncbi:hypothetical protein [Halobaculum magnesiiphilum]|uniref:Uncharacterized protein n=1 Tax=Halobaculum magnesiiphilum TaxID=1017351 RepID=A0A8T8WD29_9EURY|nr:hypothetical protein [Halobaculum magnesiiphilum]QZP37749.1 hypothetical protein K6T50_00785 [Halobaculum magnesiiphilum]
MTLDTNTDVEEIRKVQDEAGDKQPPANQAEQARTNDRLGNADAVFTDKLTPSTSGEVLPSHEVKEGCEVLVLADPDNAGPIYIGPEGSETIPLAKGNGVTKRVSNTDALAAKASSDGDTLHITGESA